VIDNSELIIRAMAIGDLADVLRWRNHPDVRMHMFTQHEISLDEHTRWFARASQDDTRHLLIYERAGVPVGFVQINEVAKGGVADWGFYLASDAPKGSGAGLGLAALTYAFKTIRLHKLCGQALASNERSIRFHKKLGFRQEGRLCQQHFDGQFYHDVLCFGLLASQWPSVI
jgi:UDP-4-amino-4,6-dideoxy-N-acetyl-beta-L-altrosamine N-acetyltransferase